MVYSDLLLLTLIREGLKDLNALKDAYKNKIEAIRQQGAVKVPSKVAIKSSTSHLIIPNTPFQPPPPPQAQTSSPVQNAIKDATAPPGVKTLSSYIDVNKTLGLPHKEIEYIWRLRHAGNPNSLCAIIPAAAYAHIALTARKHPQFVLPVPREDQGAEMHFLQWTFPHSHTASVLFTTLAEYKLRGEFASPHTTVSMHTELLEPKGIALAQGSVMGDRGITIDDGKWLFMCLQKFYGLQPDVDVGKRRKQLLEQFTNGDAGFEIKKLLDEAESLV